MNVIITFAKIVEFFIDDLKTDERERKKKMLPKKN